MANKKNRSARGFANMSAEKLREVSSRGGSASKRTTKQSSKKELPQQS